MAGFLGPSLTFSSRALNFLYYEPERFNSPVGLTLDAQGQIYEQSNRSSGDPREPISSLDCLEQAGFVSLPLSFSVICPFIHSLIHSFVHSWPLLCAELGDVQNRT